MAEFSVFQMFVTGGCRVCGKPVRGTANRHRHLRTHDEVRETRNGWLVAPSSSVPHDGPPPMCGCGHSYTDHQPPRQTFLACHKCKCGDFHSAMVA